MGNDTIPQENPVTNKQWYNPARSPLNCRNHLNNHTKRKKKPKVDTPKNVFPMKRKITILRRTSGVTLGPHVALTRSHPASGTYQGGRGPPVRRERWPKSIPRPSGPAERSNPWSPYGSPGVPRHDWHIPGGVGSTLPELRSTRDRIPCQPKMKDVHLHKNSTKKSASPI